MRTTCGSKRSRDRAHRDWTEEQIEFLSNIARLYRGEAPENLHDSAEMLAERFGDEAAYRDVPGLCKSATLDEIEDQGWSLNPGRYVGVAEREAEDVDFKARLRDLHDELERLNREGWELEERIAENAALLMAPE